MISETKKKEIDNIVFDVLNKSKSLGIYPTPVDNILKYSDLRVNTGVDLSKISNNFFAKQGLNFKRGITKIRGVLDRREKVIYLDLTQLEQKKRFVKLHEIGHESLFWQGRLHDFLDDDQTLDPDINEEFEAEANYFASGSLFQLELFNDKVQELPLELSSCIELSKIFGSSIHSSLRRYVEQSKKRCALLVLDKMQTIEYGFPKLSLRNYFQSTSFTSSFGNLIWDNEIGFELPFVQNYISRRRFIKSELVIDIDTKSIDCHYHYFNNGYNIFVLLFPKGESIKSRTTFIINS